MDMEIGYDDPTPMSETIEDALEGNVAPSADMRIHETTRKEFKWGSFGRDGTEIKTVRTLDAISDSHLLHIIGHVLANRDKFSKETAIIMMKEAEYRSTMNIYVPEYNSNHDDRTTDTEFKLNYDEEE